MGGLDKTLQKAQCTQTSIDYCFTVFVFVFVLNQMHIKQLDILLYKAAKLVSGAQKFTSQASIFN